MAGEQKNAAIIQLPLELAIIELCLGEQKEVVLKTNYPNPEIIASSPKIEKKTEIVPAENLDKIELKEGNSVTNNELEKKWVEFLIKIKHLNHSLSFVMQNSKPEGISDGILTLGFKYKLHSDRVNQAEIRDLIEKTLQEVYGAKLKIKVRLDDSLVITPRDTSEKEEEKKVEVKNPEGNSFINNFLQSFGGEIIS